ncbi:hypothetical protein KKB64_02810 [Patescibacteria group bacterium]|nr:hypothetical protein [Patescibacteria group bacterium]MBU1472689.1 hypothetical protein [Patescibacteria group bacterium]MBU2460134.1 hypothetical protein [Patescibacteria group bacterium]MBU2544385.1 hypothetical protein [Patescibacteria group bacterium]
MSAEYNKELVARIHRENAQKAVELLHRDLDSRNLGTIIDPTVAATYQRLIPRHAQLCETDQEKGLDSTQGS